MLINLITNAKKFTPKGGSITIDIDFDTKKKEILFSVIDTGCGIKKAELPNLFKMFGRL